MLRKELRRLVRELYPESSNKIIKSGFLYLIEQSKLDKEIIESHIINCLQNGILDYELIKKALDELEK